MVGAIGKLFRGVRGKVDNSVEAGFDIELEGLLSEEVGNQDKEKKQNAVIHNILATPYQNLDPLSTPYDLTKEDQLEVLSVPINSHKPCKQKLCENPARITVGVNEGRLGPTINPSKNKTTACTSAPDPELSDNYECVPLMDEEEEDDDDDGWYWMEGEDCSIEDDFCVV